MIYISLSYKNYPKILRLLTNLIFSLWKKKIKFRHDIKLRLIEVSSLKKRRFEKGIHVCTPLSRKEEQRYNNGQKNPIELPISVHPRIRISKRFCPFLYFAAAVVTVSFIVFTSRLTLHPGILRNRATIRNRPSFSSVREGKKFEEISKKFISPRLLREKYPREEFRIEIMTTAKGEKQFRWIYTYIHIRYSRIRRTFGSKMERELWCGAKN